MTLEEENQVLGGVFRRLLEHNDEFWFVGLVPSGSALILFGDDLRTSIRQKESDLMASIAPNSQRK